MQKLAGMIVDQYTIVDDSEPREEGYEYEELTLEEFLSKTNHTERTKTEFIQKYYSVNIHCLLSVETLPKCYETIDDIATDPRLAKLRAVVFLALKPQGKGSCLTPLKSTEEYRKLINYAFEKNVNVGFDSCSYPHFVKAIEGRDDYERLKQLGEPCESFGLFSAYVNVSGTYFPCSFAEHGKWGEGIDLLKVNDFKSEVWFSEKVNKWRQHSLQATQSCNCPSSSGCRVCPLFDITPCRPLK